MSNDRTWYAIYTNPRWEKKVHDLLTRKGIEAYCPLNKVEKKWSDRTKIIDEPLFKSYVFVRLNETEKTEVRFVSGVVNFVYWLGKPAVVKDSEIETIKRFLNEYPSVEVRSGDVRPDTEVVINSGAFMDKKGRVVRVMNKTVEVVIESLGYTLVAYIDKSKVSATK